MRKIKHFYGKLSLPDYYNFQLFVYMKYFDKILVVTFFEVFAHCASIKPKVMHFDDDGCREVEQLRRRKACSSE